MAAAQCAVPGTADKVLLHGVVAPVAVQHGPQPLAVLRHHPSSWHHGRGIMVRRGPAAYRQKDSGNFAHEADIRLQCMLMSEENACTYTDRTRTGMRVVASFVAAIRRAWKRSVAVGLL